MTSLENLETTCITSMIGCKVTEKKMKFLEHSKLKYPIEEGNQNSPMNFCRCFNLVVILFRHENKPSPRRDLTT